MGSRNIVCRLQLKKKKLDKEPSRTKGYLYSCGLCDETLPFSKLFIYSLKVQLSFSNTCPGCGFALERALRVQPSSLPPGRRLLTNMIGENAEQLIEPCVSLEAGVSSGST